eukprot:jgi/Chlat1/2169/Chrsp17S02736
MAAVAVSCVGAVRASQRSSRAVASAQKPRPSVASLRPAFLGAPVRVSLQRSVVVTRSARAVAPVVCGGSAETWVGRAVMLAVTGVLALEGLTGRTAISYIGITGEQPILGTILGVGLAGLLGSHVFDRIKAKQQAEQ